MKRRDDDLDSLVLDDAQAVQEVLLGGPVGRRQNAGRRAAEPVDELVDPRRAEAAVAAPPARSSRLVRRNSGLRIDEDEPRDRLVEVRARPDGR